MGGKASAAPAARPTTRPVPVPTAAEPIPVERPPETPPRQRPAPGVLSSGLKALASLRLTVALFALVKVYSDDAPAGIKPSLDWLSPSGLSQPIRESNSNTFKNP